VCMIDQKFAKAAAFAAAGAALTFFGLIHSEAIGFAMTPRVAVSYLLVAVILYGVASYAKVAAKPAEVHHPHSSSGEASSSGRLSPGLSPEVATE
jgi:AGZA family xanthine/uracil permease-like MFS transporter